MHRVQGLPSAASHYEYVSIFHSHRRAVESFLTLTFLALHISQAELAIACPLREGRFFFDASSSALLLLLGLSWEEEEGRLDDSITGVAGDAGHVCDSGEADHACVAGDVDPVCDARDGGDDDSDDDNSDADEDDDVNSVAAVSVAGFGAGADGASLSAISARLSSSRDKPAV